MFKARSMDNERIVFVEDRQKKQRKTSKIIEILLKEKTQLQEKLQILQEGSHCRRESELEAKANRLHEEIKSSQELLESEKSSLWELEGHIKKVWDMHLRYELDNMN